MLLLKLPSLTLMRIEPVCRSRFCNVDASKVHSVCTSIARSALHGAGIELPAVLRFIIHGTRQAIESGKQRVVSNVHAVEFQHGGLPEFACRQDEFDQHIFRIGVMAQDLFHRGSKGAGDDKRARLRRQKSRSQEQRKRLHRGTR